MTAAVAVCIPTADRPESVERVLMSVLEQQLGARKVIVMDASSGDDTVAVCRRMSARFPDGVLHHARSERSLTRQRRRCVELARTDVNVGYVCMLDDDVTLTPDFLERTVGFFESHEGRAYGGLSGYDVLGWGRPFDRLECLYARIGIFDGDLRPGRWLYCGRFLEMSRWSPFDGVRDVQFIGGGLTVWRAEVFDHFLPPKALDGYALLEDKHLSLRVGTKFRLGVHGGATVRHERAEGGRPKPVAMAYMQMRRLALLLRDCDPSPTASRYAAFLAVGLLDLAVRTVLAIGLLRFRSIPGLFGSAIGWLSCLVPPRPTEDSLAGRRSGSAS